MIRKTMFLLAAPIVTGLLLSGCGVPHTIADAPPETIPAPTVVLPPPTTPEPEVVISEPAVATRVAVRLMPQYRLTEQYDEVSAPLCANPEGLRCMPFYDGDPSDRCAEMNFYRSQDPVIASIERFGDQPRSGPKKQQGIGWRESNCNNGVRTSCCFGYFQIAIGNRTAAGYKAAGVFQWCGVDRASDFYGQSPLAKQKQVCVASGLYQYHLANGPYPFYPWDSFL